MPRTKRRAKKRPQREEEASGDSTDSDVLASGVCQSGDEDEQQAALPPQQEATDPLAALRDMVAAQKREQARQQALKKAHSTAASATTESAGTGGSSSSDAPAEGLKQLEEVRAVLKKQRIEKESRQPYRGFFRTLPAAAAAASTTTATEETEPSFQLLAGDTRSAVQWACALSAGLGPRLLLDQALHRARDVDEWLARLATASSAEVGDPRVLGAAVDELVRRHKRHGLSLPLSTGVALALGALRRLGGCVSCDEAQPLRTSTDDSADSSAKDSKQQEEALMVAEYRRRCDGARVGAVIRLIELLLGSAAGGAAAGDIVPLFESKQQYLELLNTVVGLAADYQQCDDEQQSAPNVFYRSAAARLRPCLVVLLDHAQPSVSDSELESVILGRACLANAFARAQTLAPLASAHAQQVHLDLVWSILQHSAAPDHADVAVAGPREATAFDKKSFRRFMKDEEQEPHFALDCNFKVVWKCLECCVLESGLLAPRVSSKGGTKQPRRKLSALVRQLQSFMAAYSMRDISYQYKDDAIVFVDWLEAMLEDWQRETDTTTTTTE